MGVISLGLGQSRVYFGIYVSQCVFRDGFRLLGPEPRTHTENRGGGGGLGEHERRE